MSRPIVDAMLALIVLTIVGLVIMSYAALLGGAELRLAERLVEATPQTPPAVLWRSTP